VLLALGIAWPVLLVAIYCLALFGQMIHNQSVRGAQVEFQRRVSEGRNLRTMLLDMETGIRGYLLSHDSSYLQPYTQASTELPGELKQLSAVSDGDPTADRQSQKIASDVAEWTSTAQVLVGSQAPAGKIDPEVMARAKNQFDELRQSMQSYLDESMAKDRQYEVLIRQNRDRIKMIAGLGGVGLAAGLILGILVLARRIAETYHRTTVAYEGESKRARDASDLYRLITDNSADLISLVDRGGRYTFVSPSFEKVLGLKGKDLIGRRVDELINHEDGESDERWRNLFNTGAGQEMIRHQNSSGGWAWIEVNARRIDGTLVAVGRDVSESVRISDELKRLNSELELRVGERTEELSVANAELEAFSYSVSHDLRAPLRSIASFSLILQQDVGAQLDEESQDNLGRIRAAAAKMTELIDALLTFSRIVRAGLNRTEVDLTHMAETIIAELRRTSTKDVEVRVRAGMKDEADPHLVRIVLENLIENAWKFTSKTPNPKIEIGYDNGAYFVQDNGAGFDQQFANKLFLPFERLHTEREFPGTGIGLATTKRIIDRHGGRVWAESTPGVRTTFYFTLRASDTGNYMEANEVSNP